MTAPSFLPTLADHALTITVAIAAAVALFESRAEARKRRAVEHADQMSPPSPTHRGRPIPPAPGPSTREDFDQAALILAEGRKMRPEAAARLVWAEYRRRNSIGLREELLLALAHAAFTTVSA